MKLSKAIRLSENLETKIFNTEQEILNNSTSNISFEDKFKKLIDLINKSTTLKLAIHTAKTSIIDKYLLFEEYNTLFILLNNIYNENGHHRLNELINDYEVKLNSIIDEIEEYEFNIEIDFGD